MKFDVGYSAQNLFLNARPVTPDSGRSFQPGDTLVDRKTYKEGLVLVLSVLRTFFIHLMLILGDLQGLRIPVSRWHVIYISSDLVQDIFFLLPLCRTRYLFLTRQQRTKYKRTNHPQACRTLDAMGKIINGILWHFSRGVIEWELLNISLTLNLFHSNC